MTDYQDALVLENLDLVNWVIRTRISIPNRPLLTYDDFYAIGCEAICRAALKYQPDTSVSRDCLSKSRSIFLESATPSFWSWRMEATYSGFWMDDINSKLEAYIDFTSKNRPMISRISRRPFSRPRLYLALKNSLFLQASRFRYSGMRIIGMLCLQCSLLDVFSSGSFLRCEPVSFTQAY